MTTIVSAFLKLPFRSHCILLSKNKNKNKNKNHSIFPSGGIFSHCTPPLSRPFHRISSPAARSFTCYASASDMDSKASIGLYPAHRCKTIYLVRHAQGFHNVAGEKDHELYMSYDYIDATLTPLGWEQVDNLRKHVHASGIFKKIELVIVSPLTRTMQTAVGVFGGEGYSIGMDATPLMVENAWDSGRPAIPSLNCPPFLAVEQCREHLGVHPCDKRRSVRENKPVFPAIDFSLIESDDDTLWKEDVRETDPEIAARGMKFMEWLWTREEKEIAIVSHSGFLYQTLSAFGNDCHSSVKSEICTHFANCELRSLVLVDRGFIGPDNSATNFPGKVLSGADLPSDVADKKLEQGL
ncbi:hypothetical protein V2J09_017929 [Rumex salicifolius]